MTDTIATFVEPSATVAAALAAVALTLAAAIYWSRRRRTPTRTREKLFVGRWGDFGPELYVVGKRVRRLSGPQRRDRHVSRGTPPPTALSFAGSILAEVMHCQPATDLARAFATAQLRPVPPDGFVLPASDVEAWLNTPHSEIGPVGSDDPPRPG